MFHLDQVQGLGEVLEVDALNGAIIPDEMMKAIFPYLIKKTEAKDTAK